MVRTYAGSVAGTIPAYRGEINMQSSALALKISEACAAARVGRTALYQAIQRGELPARKRGKSTLILVDDLRRWVESLPAVTTLKPFHKREERP
jgi:excisionase family DNA binding protein